MHHLFLSITMDSSLYQSFLFSFLSLQSLIVNSEVPDEFLDTSLNSVFDFLGAGTGGCSRSLAAGAGLSSIGGADAKQSSTMAELSSISCSPSSELEVLLELLAFELSIIKLIKEQLC